MSDNQQKPIIKVKRKISNTTAANQFGNLSPIIERSWRKTTGLKNIYSKRNTPGSSTAKYHPTMIENVGKMYSITSMDEFSQESFEEIRLEDYSTMPKPITASTSENLNHAFILSPNENSIDKLTQLLKTSSLKRSLSQDQNKFQLTNEKPLTISKSFGTEAPIKPFTIFSGEENKAGVFRFGESETTKFQKNIPSFNPFQPLCDEYNKTQSNSRRSRYCGTKKTIQYIPIIGLIEAFGKLGLKDMKNIRLVSQRWKSLVEHSFVQKSTIVLENCTISQNCPPWNVLVPSNLKILNLKIGKHLKLDENQSEFWLKIGKFVKNVTLMDGQNLKANFLLHFGELSHVYFEVWNDFMKFEIPEWVQSIQLKYVPSSMNKEEKAKFDKVLGIKNLTEITASFVENLQSEDALSEIVFPKDILTGQVKISPKNFLKINKIDYTDILDVWVYEKSQNVIPILHKLMNLEDLRLKEANGCINFHESSLKFEKVQRIHIQSAAQDENKSMPCEICVKNLAQCCPSIDSFVASANFTALNDYLKVLAKPLRSLVMPKFLDFLKSPKTFRFLQKLDIFNYSSDLDLVYFVKILVMCPVMEEICLKIVSSEEVLLAEDHWPNLKIFGFSSIKCGNTLKSIVNGLQGKFTKLQKLGDAGNAVDTKEKDNYGVILFEKIPTLRQSYWMSYNEFLTIKQSKQ